MSGLSSFFPSKIPLLGARAPAAPGQDALRFALETMPGSRKYVFTPATRAEVLAVLYDAFWGPYAHLFLPNSNSSLPMHATLAEVQTRLRFGGAGGEDPAVSGRPCGHIFKKGQSCFRCKECALDDSCVMCSRCFHATDHTGHNISFFIAQQSGGSCDCGDLEAWRTPINCPHHPPSPTPSADAASIAAVLATPARTPSSPPPKAVWAADVSPVKNYPFRVSVPPELRESMARTIGYALDFVLDTLDYSPDEVGVPKDENELRQQPSGDPMLKDTWAIVVWNDDKHSFDEVIQLTVDTTGRPRNEAGELALRIDEVGRDVVDMGTQAAKLLDTAKTFAQVDLGVTMRRAYDTFREQVVSVIVEWLLDLTRSRLGTDALILREIIAQELLSPRKRDLAQLANLHEHSKVVPGDLGAARIDWMFLYHAKLWKRPRLNLKEMYASILSLSHEHKLAVAVRFSNIYPRIIDAYLLIDREAETSIKYFALQLFTVPSVALHIVSQHGIVARLLAIVAAFFTNQIADKSVTYPPNALAEIDVDAYPFKSKRFMPVFSDLRCLCHNAPVQALIARERGFVAGFAKTCQLFMCVNPNKRAVASHVEYETDAWISVFNVTLSLSRVIKVYGEAFGKGHVAELVSAITTVVHHILMVCTLSDDRLDRTKFSPIEFHDVEFGTANYQIIRFDVLEGWVSFHHSLHWLLAELFKHVHLLSDERLQEVGLASMRDILLRNASERAIQTIVDFPLRVLTMVAQIRTGLWVRNGFAIRGQLLHYRDFMLRELCYDQDLFILQTALVVLDPNTVIVSILDRFQLLNYFAGITAHEAYEDAQLSGMVEEVLYVLIAVLTEQANASGMPLDVAVRREIVHALAVGPCTFTDLVKRVAERMVEDISFERGLKEVANFRAPETNADSGTYELKDEAYDEVNPFFYHYTRNKREEVETILLNRLKKKTGQADPVIVPRPVAVASGPFSSLVGAFDSEVLLQIMFFSIYNVLAATNASGGTPPSAEAILDQTLYLIMVALNERGSTFSQFTVAKSFAEDKNLIDVLCLLEYHDRYKTYKARADWILNQLSRHIPDEVDRRRTKAEAVPKPPDSGDAKKRAAKARQEAIMKQMKAQQASFAINFEDADDDEDDDMGEAEHPISFGTCIVCQEDLNGGSKPFGMLGLLQPSRLVRRQPMGQGSYTTQGLWFNEVLQMPASLDRTPDGPKPCFPPPDSEIQDSKPTSNTTFEAFPTQSTRFGLYSSICSHMMHLDCFNIYSLSMRQRHRNQATRNHPESLSRKEYICPLCKSLGNIMLPVSIPVKPEINPLPFADWIRASGISILKSKPDPLMESLQFKTGTGEFVFWSAQDPQYISSAKTTDTPGLMDMHKIVDTVMATAKVVSQQTRHLRDRPEPDPGERGAGLYLPEELVGYTISMIEAAQRGTGSQGSLVADNVTEAQIKMVRGLVACLSKLAALHFRGRPDEGREAIRHSIIKRLLPEWSRASHTAFSYPLLLRDPFTLLVEASACAPEMLRHIVVLTYYACLARSVIGIVHLLHKTRSFYSSATAQRQHESLFGDVRMFFMSVVRHSPVFESSASMVFKSFGEAHIEKLLYAFTLPFLRRAAILCRSMLPSHFPVPTFDAPEPCEYARLLTLLRIPPLADLPNQDALQNALSGWCAHYGHLHAASQNAATVLFDYPAVYEIARLPVVLDNLFDEKALSCARCGTSPMDAAVCLICGAVCCMQSHCCIDLEAGRGECNMHTRECGGAVGIYFCVKRCSLLYLYAGNGTFASSPYLDVHGEVDMSMRRGRRQFLHPARWEEIRKIWLNHGIPTLVARKLESTVDSGGWETL